MSRDINKNLKSFYSEKQFEECYFEFLEYVENSDGIEIEQIEEVIALCDRWLAKDKASEIYCLRGYCNMLLEKYEAAKNDFNKSIEADSLNFSAYENLCQTLILNGQENEADKVSYAAAEADYISNSTYDNIRSYIIAGEDIETAAVRISNEIKTDNIEELNNLGIYFFNRGQLKLALDLFEKAIAINPLHEESYLNMIAIYQSENQYDEIISLCSSILESYSDFFMVHNAYVTAILDKDTLENPNRKICEDPDLSEFKAKVKVELVDDFDIDNQALLNLYLIGLDTMPDNPVFYLGLGHSYDRQNNAKLALRCFKKVVALAPNSKIAAQATEMIENLS